jgi:tellurite methyltransferase
MHPTTPNPLLVKFAPLLADESLTGAVLDLACGTGENGLHLAGLGLPVVLADRSAEALEVARRAAADRGLNPEFWQVDLEAGADPLPEEHYRGMLVFHYLHRPLVPHIRAAIRPGGLLIYETFTAEQAKYGRPHNPDFLLQPGELAGWFEDWETIHYFEGLIESPRKAVAQIVCRKPRGMT